MPVPRSVAFAVVTALLPVAGCVETPPGPLPQATPSWSCTPVAGGTPYACYEHQYQQTSAQNKLYEEAEAVYRKLNAEDERIYRAGGVKEPTPVIEESYTESMLTSAMADYIELANSRTRMVRGEFKIAWIKRVLEQTNGSVAVLTVCSDISDVWLKTGDGKERSLGQDGMETLYFVPSAPTLRIANATSEWVKSC
jgi:hypothetical protein